MNSQRTFDNACQKGDMETVKRMIHNAIVSDHTFIWTCGYGHLEIAKLLYETKLVSSLAIKEGFMYACANGHLAVAQWLYGLNKIDISEGCKYAYKSNQLEICKWLHEIEPTAFTEGISYFIYGGINTIQWLYAVRGNSINHATMVSGYIRACEIGELVIAQWFRSVIDDADDKLAFTTACKRGRLNIARWLVNTNKAQIAIDDTFVLACNSGALRIAEWLLIRALRDNIHINESKIVEAYKYACSNENEYFAEWLRNRAEDLDISVAM